MTHDPLCGLSQPCDDETPEHGYCSMQHGEFCIHCHQWCICDVIAKVRAEATAAAVQRVEEQAAMWQEQTLTRLGIGIALAAINKGQS